LFYIIIVVTLSVLAERSTPQFVFQTFTMGRSGWENAGVTWGIGLLTATFAVNGYDGVLHMSISHLSGTGVTLLTGTIR